MSQYSLYKMERNVYLEECLAIVCAVSPAECLADGLQRSNILLLAKSANPLPRISTIEQLRETRIFSTDRAPLLRISSECLPGIFGDSHCECEAQRVASLRKIATYGQGLYVHLPQEGQGHGLFYKAQELQIQVSGIAPDGSIVGKKSVTEASEYLLGRGSTLDRRGYTALARILRETALNQYTYGVITDSPDKMSFITKELRIDVQEHYSVKRPITVENAGEFLAKLYKKGYTVSNQELEEIYLCLFAAEQLPGRVLGLLRSMAEDLLHGRQFAGDLELIRKIIHVAKARGPSTEQVHDINALRDVSSYEEYQVELSLDGTAIEKLFEARVLGGIDSLRYEENHFYDVVSFDGVPTRSLKIRYAYRLTDRTTPTEVKFIYKVPIGDKMYRIRSLPLRYDDIAKILGFVLRDYEQHFLPVFTHNVFAGDGTVTALVKRYSKGLRTVSLMGPEVNVRRLIDRVCSIVDAEEIPDPSNALFLNRKISLDFEYDTLAKEEIDLYRVTIKKCANRKKVA